MVCAERADINKFFMCHFITEKINMNGRSRKLTDSLCLDAERAEFREMIITHNRHHHVLQYGITLEDLTHKHLWRSLIGYLK